VHVHICNHAAQSGASLFTQTHSDWTYNKTEYLTASDLTQSPWFTHAVVEDYTPEQYHASHWTVLEKIPGFNGVRIGIPPKVVTETKLWLLERSR